MATRTRSRPFQSAPGECTGEHICAFGSRRRPRRGLNSDAASGAGNNAQAAFLERRAPPVGAVEFIVQALQPFPLLASASDVAACNVNSRSRWRRGTPHAGMAAGRDEGST